MGRKKMLSPTAKILSIALTTEQYDKVEAECPKDMKISVYGRLKLLGEIK